MLAANVLAIMAVSRVGFALVEEWELFVTFWEIFLILAVVMPCEDGAARTRVIN